MIASLFGTKKTVETKVVRAPVKRVENVTMSDDTIMATVSAGLANDGFNVAKVRAQVIKVMNYKVLLVLLVAYVQTGNGLIGRIGKGKVVDKNIAQNVIDLMKACGITEKSSTSDGLTLPRIAIAFAAMVVSIRDKLKLPARIQTASPIHLQDLCLNGYASHPKIAGCDDYVNKFSWVLAQANNKKAQGKNGFVPETEEQTKQKVLEFRAISVMNQSSDPIGARVLNEFEHTDAPAKVAKMYGFDDVLSAPEVREAEVQAAPATFSELIEESTPQVEEEPMTPAEAALL